LYTEYTSRRSDEGAAEIKKLQQKGLLCKRSLVSGAGSMHTRIIGDPRKDLYTGIIVAVTGAFIFVAAIAVFGAMIYRRVGEINSMRSEIQLRLTEVDILARLTSGYAAARPYLDALKNILPAKDELIVLDRDLEALAKEVGVGFGFSFRGETLSSQSGAGAIQFDLLLQGDFFKLLEYLDRVNKLTYYIKFPGVQLTSGPGGYVMSLSGILFTR